MIFLFILPPKKLIYAREDLKIKYAKYVSCRVGWNQPTLLYCTTQMPSNLSTIKKFEL
jgi:hypothetical protein